ncbi:hypothetical protein IFT54_05455 [Sphingomonas sp. CFBP 13714]|uniref:hypothetical protein n=1 Tax=Sphingomonas sp. CFBP 13714 TaxID=2775308 RepID=UPI0017833B5F|nr:hypothetical protein [Sphingomonas sp. CFBP 13714]MBD8699261.1 hypothetical protein [Sphingomonas sp. CFBP 13714]
MAKNILTLATATKLVSDFHTSLNATNAANAASRSELAVASREQLYRVLADAYGKSLALVADPTVLGQVCQHYNSAAPAEGENPHSAVVRMMWRKKDPATKKWAPDRSAWKYGKGFRAAQDLGWTVENFAANLPEFSFKIKKDGKDKVLKGHAALEAHDTSKFGNTEAKRTEHESNAAIAWMAKTQPSLGNFQADLAEGAQDRQLANVIVQYDAATNSWHVRGVTQSDPERAWAGIAQPTLKAFDNWLKEMAVKKAVADLGNLPPEGDELFEALADHNSEMDRANAKATWTNRLVGFTRDGDFAWPSARRETAPITSSDDDASVAA